MLTRLRGLVVLTVVAAATVLGASTTAYADGGTGGVQCTQNDPRPACDVNAGTGGRNGENRSTGGSTNGGRGGDGKCRKPSGEVIPCQRDGAWAGSDGCYYAPTYPSASTIAALGGQPAGEGGWYVRTCYSPISGGEQAFGEPVWIAGAPPVISPAVLARQARARLNLPKVAINFNPPGKQLTRLPTWLMLDRSSWKEQSATASVPGVSVTATARPVKATWRMGDRFIDRPEGVVVCNGPGTAWKVGTDPKAASPDCGYTYRRSPAGVAGEKFHVRVTVVWEVTWAGAGESGTIPGLATTGTVLLPVQESQAVIS
jgi:hypothetical protein